eukprot:tig00001477_g8893.t1
MTSQKRPLHLNLQAAQHVTGPLSLSARPRSSGVPVPRRPLQTARPRTVEGWASRGGALQAQAHAPAPPPFDPYVEGPYSSGEEPLSPSGADPLHAALSPPSGPPPGPRAPRRSWPIAPRPGTGERRPVSQLGAGSSLSQYSAWTAPPARRRTARRGRRRGGRRRRPRARRPPPPRRARAPAGEAASWGRERRRLERQAGTARAEADALRRANLLLESRLLFFQRKFEEARQALEDRAARDRLREELGGARRAPTPCPERPGGRRGGPDGAEGPARSESPLRGGLAATVGPERDAAPPERPRPPARPGPAPAGRPVKLRAVAGLASFAFKGPASAASVASAASLAPSDPDSLAGYKGRLLGDEDVTEMLLEGAPPPPPPPPPPAPALPLSRPRPGARAREAAAGTALCRVPLSTFSRFQKLAEARACRPGAPRGARVWGGGRGRAGRRCGDRGQEDPELLASELERAAAELARGEHATLFVPSPDGAHLQAASAAGPRRRSGWWWRTSRWGSRVRGEVDGWPGHATLSLLCVPVHDRHGTLRAVLRVANRASGGRFVRADGLIVSLLAHQAAVTWEWIDKEADLASLKERLKAAAAFAVGMAVTKDRTGFVDTVAEAAKGALEADRCSVFLPDRRTEMLYARSRDGFIGVPMTAGVAGHVFTTGREVNILDAWHDKRFRSENDELTGYHTRSILCYPVLSSDGTVLAVLQALNRKAASPFFTPGDAELFAVYAFILGLLLEHSDMYQRLRGRRAGEENEESIRDNVKRLERLLRDFDAERAPAPA